MRFWPPGSHPATQDQQNVGTAGSARHPTIAPGGPRPTGHTIRSRSVPIVQHVAQPDPLAVQLAGSMAMATNTFSPMAHGQNEFHGDAGYGVNRFAGKLARPLQNFTSPVRPIVDPLSIRTGMQAGPSSQPAFPGTGTDSGMGSLAAMNGNVLGWVS